MGPVKDIEVKPLMRVNDQLLVSHLVVTFWDKEVAEEVRRKGVIQAGETKYDVLGDDSIVSKFGAGSNEVDFMRIYQENLIFRSI